MRPARNAKFLGDAFLQFVYMRDHADEAVSLSKLLQDGDYIIQLSVIKGPETLIDEQRVQFLPARMVLHHVGKAQCKRQRHHETLTAGHTAGRALFSRLPIQHLYFQSRNGIFPPCVYGMNQLKAPAGHDIQPSVCHIQNFTESRAHHIAVKAQFTALAIGTDSQHSQTTDALTGAIGPC